MEDLLEDTGRNSKFEKLNPVELLSSNEIIDSIKVYDSTM